jgi:hypothetical protein
VLFSLLHLVAFPQYVLVLSPLPALLMAGGFDGEAEPSLATKWLHRLRWTHLALLGVLTLTTLHWLAARGGADGDYGVGYATRLQQAREIVSMAERGVEPGKLKPVESLPTQCHPPELVTVWLSIQLDPRSHGFLESVRVCESWVESDGRAELRWEVIAVQ